MKKISYAFIVGTMFLLGGCGTGSDVCESKSDCQGNEECLWMKRGTSVVGKRCVLKCSTANDCGGQSCSGSASTCPACTDNVLICLEE